MAVLGGVLPGEQATPAMRLQAIGLTGILRTLTSPEIRTAIAACPRMTASPASATGCTPPDRQHDRAGLAHVVARHGATQSSSSKSGR